MARMVYLIAALQVHVSFCSTIFNKYLQLLILSFKGCNYDSPCLPQCLPNRHIEKRGLTKSAIGGFQSPGSTVLSNTTHLRYYKRIKEHRRKQEKRILLLDVQREKTTPANLGKSRENFFGGIFGCIQDVIAALTYFKRSDSGHSVETTSRLVQWRIPGLPPCINVTSDPFRIGNWNWHLSIRKYRGQIIRLYPETAREYPPVASFIIRIVYSHDNRKALTHPGVRDKQLVGKDDFIWKVETPLKGKFIIEVEFTDLKSASPNGGELYSLWTEKYTEKESSPTAVNSFGRMLSESIHTDITINTSDGSIQAHRAVLSIRSSVFRSMFSHDLKEKELSTLDISDISLEACNALLNYIYGDIKHNEFLTHRLALLYAAEKYDISDLKDACQESLIEDIDATNVLERLQVAFLYQLPKLKTSCKQYLVKFSKVFDIQEDFNIFLQCADKELISEIFHEIFHAWKGF